MLEKIKEVIAETLYLYPEQVTDETNIVEDLGADLLDLADICMALEEVFDVEFSTEDLEGIKTVEDIMQYIQDKKSGRG